jgi:hypothetical protein
MLLAGFSFGIAMHDFIEEEWVWGFCNVALGFFNLVLGLIW